MSCLFVSGLQINFSYSPTKNKVSAQVKCDFAEFWDKARPHWCLGIDRVASVFEELLLCRWIFTQNKLGVMFLLFFQSTLLRTSACQAVLSLFLTFNFTPKLNFSKRKRLICTLLNINLTTMSAFTSASNHPLAGTHDYQSAFLLLTHQHEAWRAFITKE